MVSPGRVAFTVFGIDIMWYGVLIGFAFILGTLINYRRAPKLGLKPDTFLDVIIWLIPASLVGARLYYVIFNWSYYSNNLAEIINTRNGGLAIHGGLILGIIAVYFVSKHDKESFPDVLDLMAPVVPLGQAIGRWGNFFNEEAHGTETDLPWAQIIDGKGYHPTFLYESIWCFLLFIFLIWFSNYRRSFKGQIICLYFMLYSIERFFVESLRTDSLMIGPLRQAQVISIVIFIAAFIIYHVLRKKYPLAERPAVQE
ncbi:MAG: prolipoprotein diacylglyceryl transferase [Firmicutes bacterium]|nr:prolipoprotein diacylglyceryl transferase [Bacillota bacterium]